MEIVGLAFEKGLMDSFGHKYVGLRRAKSIDVLTVTIRYLGEFRKAMPQC